VEIRGDADGSMGVNTPMSGGSWGRLQRKGDAERRPTTQWLWLPMGRFSAEPCSEASCDEVGRFHPSVLFFAFHSLTPFTSYKLRVKATNDIGDSDFSAETEAVTTLQDGKRGGEALWGYHRGVGTPLCCWARWTCCNAVEGKFSSQCSFVHRRLIQVEMICG